MTEQEFQTFLRSIRPADRAAMDAAARRQAELAKPPGSLGALEDVSIRLAGLTGRVKNRIDRCRVLVFAADNGVTAEGVSATPVSVTLSQSINMTRHITGMSALAAAFGDSVVVTDVGIDADVRCPEIVDRKIRRSTGDIAREPAMTREQALTAISVGMEQAQRAAQDGMQAVGIGEMGIGNTTTSAAVLAALTGLAPEELTGRGAGLTDDAFRKKKDVIRRALTLHRPDPADPVGVLSAVGGLDLAAMTGAFLGLAAAHVPAVADGLISVVAALCAVRLCPAARDAIFLSHASKEPGYRRAAEELGLAPFLQLGMRLGEGSGCPLAFQVLKAACAVMAWRRLRRPPSTTIIWSPSARRMRSAWTRHENFTGRRQQKRKKRPCAAALRPACRWCTHDLLGDDGAGGRRGPRPHRPPSGRARGLGLQHGRVRPGAGARRTAGEGLRAV